MAMLASKSPFPTARGMSTSSQMSSSTPQSAGAGIHTAHRLPMISAASHGSFASPTESEFSEAFEGPDSVRCWSENRVGEWLREIHCGQYEALFKEHNFNGDNLLECDQAVLKDMGIKKIGDRVRIQVAIKNLRNKAFANHRKRNRDSFAALDNPHYPLTYTPSSSGSPRPLNISKGGTSYPAPLLPRRTSRPFEGSFLDNSPGFSKHSSRPKSPNVGLEASHTGRTPRNPLSPIENSGRDLSSGYFTAPSARGSASTPGDPSISSRSTHSRQTPSIDGSVMGGIPAKVNCIRVIYTGGETRMVQIRDCRTSDEIIHSTLKKWGLREDHIKNYCFYILDGTEPDPAHCRRIHDAELVRICGDPSRVERNRFILRKIHAGEPGDEELQRAAAIALEESNQALKVAYATTSTRSQKKVAQITGEKWETFRPPVSPYPQTPTVISAGEREYNVNSAAQDLERPEPGDTRGRKGVLRQFFGQRPPSELISSDLAAYFPEHEKADIEKTVRMSMRRSARLSRAMSSRMSVASNLSFGSSMKDAPPIPSIAESWLTGANVPARTPRPLSLSRVGLPQSSYRDSMASTMLQPLPEESPIEPDRKSYVSFDSSSELAHHDPSGSYYDDAHSTPVTESGGSLNDTLSQALDEDGEEKDEELTRFLAGDSWEAHNWMKGALIGQGSFGSVYLALHSITGELMAVKQVEMPSNAGSVMDNKKKGMVEALKREIGLLRELQHPNIVQYLGSSSDDEHLNIFLEYVPGGSVAAMLNSYGALREPLIRNFVRQILTGLAYLHGREIIHRDIKGANVLVDNKGGIKISDFGISKRVEASTLLKSGAAGHAHRPSLQGSVYWMAPEVVKQTSYTRKADIWSLGCLVVEMFTGNHPYPDCSQLQAIFKIGNSKASPTLPDNASEEAKTFLRQTFELDHNKRPSADELLLSPFLNQIA
ncbi:MAG: ATP binding [Trizodia sp. TS-e1964]|nr:MAG: ATP binding [Trizodia sp. TS-e1964]